MSDSRDINRLMLLKHKINEHFGVAIESDSRARNVVYARKIYCKIAYENYGNLSLERKALLINLKHDALIYHKNTFYLVYDRHKEYYEKLTKLNYRSEKKKRKDALRLALFYRNRLNKILGAELRKVS